MSEENKTEPNILQKSLYWLRKFFATYFWLGVVLLLLSIILDLNYPQKDRAYWFSIVMKLIEATGASILIASIFTFASGTSDFVDKIKELLEDIVVRRNFLANIDPDGKKEALKALIQPSTSEKNKYPNIGDYYGYFIYDTMNMSTATTFTLMKLKEEGWEPKFPRDNVKECRVHTFPHWIKVYETESREEMRNFINQKLIVAEELAK